MHHTEARELLHDYVDGTLSRDVRAALTEHLARCAACRQEVEDLRALLDAARALPREIEPQRNLWPGVATAMRRRSLWEILRMRRPILAAGATVAAAAAILIFALSGHDHPSPVPPENPYFTAMLQALETECRTSDWELRAYGCAEPDSLSALALTVIEENLATLDRAIAETRVAWAADTGSALWGCRLAEQYRTKLALQEQALHLSTQT